MISGQWFQIKRSKNLKKLHKITNNSIKNRGSTLILNKSGTGSPLQRNIHTKFATNPCIDFIKNGINKDRLLKD